MQQPRDEWNEILKPVGPSGEHDNTNPESSEVLLVLQILIRRHEHVILRFGGAQQIPVLQPRPSPVIDCVHFNV